jgi:NADH:ubiquinone oxidoreductase subunit 5 (subunit L)/multisubunit Na+/H+ antiporter MnhA subunit
MLTLLGIAGLAVGLACVIAARDAGSRAAVLERMGGFLVLAGLALLGAALGATLQMAR